MKKTEFSITNEYGNKVPCSIEGNFLEINTRIIDISAIEELLSLQDCVSFSEAIDCIILFIAQILSVIIQAEIYNDIAKKFMISPGTEDIFELRELSRILRKMEVRKE